MLSQGHGGGEATDFSTPLPSGVSESAYGTPSKWPASLQAYTVTVSAFGYPAALFWGEEFVRFHNEAWSNISGNDQQGQKQRGILSADAFTALTAALHGGKPKRVEATELLPTDKFHKGEHTVLISPVFEDQDAVGLLVQLYPKLLEPGQSQNTTGHVQIASDSDDKAAASREQGDFSELGSVANELPIDEHVSRTTPHRQPLHADLMPVIAILLSLRTSLALRTCNTRSQGSGRVRKSLTWSLIGLDWVLMTVSGQSTVLRSDYASQRG